MEISIKGEKYGLLWGLSAINRFCELVDLDIENALNTVFAGDGKNQMAQTIALAKFMCCAIDSYAKVNRTVAGVDYEDILMEFDNQGIKLVEKVLEDFMASKILGQSVSDYLGLTAPVKEVKTKKKPSQAVK